MNASEKLAELNQWYQDRENAKIDAWLIRAVQEALWLRGKFGPLPESKISQEDLDWLLDITKEDPKKESKTGTIAEEHGAGILMRANSLLAEIDALTIHLEQKADAKLKAELQAFFDQLEKS